MRSRITPRIGAIGKHMAHILPAEIRDRQSRQSTARSWPVRDVPDHAEVYASPASNVPFMIPALDT